MRTALALLLLTPLAVRPSGAAPFAYVSNEKAGNVTVIDLATDRPVAAITTGGRPRGIQVSADGKTLYVSRAGLERARMFSWRRTADSVPALPSVVVAPGCTGTLSSPPTEPSTFRSTAATRSRSR